MTFAQPAFLLLGIALATAFLAFARANERRGLAAALAYSDLAFLEHAIGSGPPWTAIFAGVWASALVLAGGALARPSVVATLPVRDAAIVLCIDTSGSMASTDIAPTRAQAARAAATTFIDALPEGTRIGLVAFSTTALPLGALGDSRDDARLELERLPSPNGGTAIGDALTVAAQLLPAGGRRAIVLVTDGVNNAGSDPLAAAEVIGGRGILIFTVGIGTNGSGLEIPGTNEDAELDEGALRAIAASGNGSYAQAGDAGALRDRLGGLARTTVDQRRRVDVSGPCALAAGLLAFGATLAALALGRFP